MTDCEPKPEPGPLLTPFTLLTLLTPLTHSSLPKPTKQTSESAKRRASVDNLQIPNGLTSPKQLYWHRLFEHNQSTPIYRPCRIIIDHRKDTYTDKRKSHIDQWNLDSSDSDSDGREDEDVGGEAHIEYLFHDHTTTTTINTTFTSRKRNDGNGNRNGERDNARRRTISRRRLIPYHGLSKNDATTVHVPSSKWCSKILRTYERQRLAASEQLTSRNNTNNNISRFQRSIMPLHTTNNDDDNDGHDRCLDITKHLQFLHRILETAKQRSGQDEYYKEQPPSPTTTTDTKTNETDNGACFSIDSHDDDTPTRLNQHATTCVTQYYLLYMSLEVKSVVKSINR